MRLGSEDSTLSAKGHTRLLVALALVSAAAAAYAADPPDEEEGKNGFRVESSDPADYRGTRQDVESNITDDLAVKLRQFDEWTVENEEQQAVAAAQGGGSDAAGGTRGSGAPRTGGAQADGEDDRASPTDLPAGDIETANTNSTAREEVESLRSVQPPRPDKRAEEDDVARMLREAAEQETDPERRKALMDQYDAYLRNR